MPTPLPDQNIVTDAVRQTIPYVRVTDASGQVKEYVAPEHDRVEMFFATSICLEVM